MGFLQNKRALIVGVASNRSIAYGIAEAMAREGAEIALTYQNEKLKERVEKLAGELGAKIVLPCDVVSDDEITTLFAELGQRWDGLYGNFRGSRNPGSCPPGRPVAQKPPSGRCSPAHPNADPVRQTGW